MVKPEIIKKEQHWVEALRCFNIIDTFEEIEYDAFTRLQLINVLY